MTVVRRVIKGLMIDLNSSKNLVSIKSTLVEELLVLFCMVTLAYNRVLDLLLA